MSVCIIDYGLGNINIKFPNAHSTPTTTTATSVINISNDLISSNNDDDDDSDK